MRDIVDRLKIDVEEPKAKNSNFLVRDLKTDRFGCSRHSLLTSVLQSEA